MWHYIKGHFRPFWTGFVGSGVVWGNILFADVGTAVGEYFIRLLGAAAIAFASGLCTIAATDFWKEIKSRYKKKKDARLKNKENREIEKGKRSERA